MNLFHITFPRDSGGSRNSYRYASPELIKGCGKGFILSPFGSDAPIYTIPRAIKDFSDEKMTGWCLENDRLCPAPTFSSTPRESHLRLVGDAVKFVKGVEAETGSDAKVIAARVKAVATRRSLPEIYDSLTEAYPDACVFLFSTPVSGTWIGASPELLCSLMKSDHDWRLHTVALAGTRPAGTKGNWDEKNRNEQRIVTEFITSSLEGLGMKVREGSTGTRVAGGVEHIITNIFAEIPDSGNISIEERAACIFNTLSPTPALCGAPREMALQFIMGNEPQPREFYGGYFGMLLPHRTDMFVNLRSGRLLPDNSGLLLYAGGGITRDSEPAAEWDETERKLSTVMTHL